jgi:hypothetical protein
MPVDKNAHYGQGFFKDSKAIARQIDEKTAQFTPIDEIDFSIFP